MQKKLFRFELISRFKFQSILLKTLFLLLLLMVFTIGGIYLIYSHLVTVQYKDASRAAQHLHLTAISNALESELVRAATHMDAAFSNQAITGLLISPTRSDYNRLLNVMEEVQALPGSQELIRQSWLYVYGNDMVYSSDGVMTPILESAEKKLIISCVTDRGQASALSLEDLSFQLLEKDGRLFLFQLYPQARPLGILICELDTELLYRSILEASGRHSGSVAYPYDQHTLPLLESVLPYPVEPIDMSDISGLFTLEQQEVTVYQYRSPSTGMSYLSTADNADLLPTFPLILQAAFPYLLVMCLLVCGLSVYLIWVVYKPIQDVIYSMVASGRSKDIRSGGNEFDFIRTMYRDSTDKNAVLSGLLSQVAPAVTDRVFHSLMSDTPPDTDSIEATMGSIGAPFPMDGRYLVLLFHITQSDDMDIHDVDKEIHTALLLTFTNSHWSGRALCHCTRTGDGVCAVILCFSDDTSKAQIKFAVSDFCETVWNQSEGMRYHWTVGTGQLCVGLIGVQESFLTAREDLSRQIYYHRQSAAKDPLESKDLLLGASYFTGRIRQLIYDALEGKLSDPSACFSLIGEAARNTADPLQLHSIYQQMHNLIIEEMVKLHIDISSIPDNLSLLQAPDSTGEELLQSMRRFCGTALKLIQDAGQWGQNKHADSAKKYISTHYTDKDLSLDEVSRHIGISSPYLSKIFSQSVGVGFLDYLNQYRIDKAKQLLRATNLQVAEIGFQVGFQSSQNFTRVFKRLMGVTPSQYRDSMKNNPLKGRGEPDDK